MHNHDQEFINPYTFVPFPSLDSGPRKTLPHHHELAAGRYCGRISVTAVARTDIMVRGVTENDEPLLPWRPRPDGGRQAIIPGSSLAGAVRSMHETLAGGCLRVFNRDFLPTYRDAASSRSFEGLVMGLVADVDSDGRPVKMRLCTDVVWTDAVALRSLIAEPLRTGMVLRIGHRRLPSTGNVWGREIVDVTRASVETDPVSGTWLVLVGDAGAREKVTTFRVALARIPDEVEPVIISKGVWPEYTRCALDSADMRTHRKDPESLRRQRLAEAVLAPASARAALTAEVTWKKDPSLPIGRRQLVRPWTRPGTVLWVRLGDSDEGENKTTIVDVRPAVLWRHSGEHPAGERVPPGLLACQDPMNLCPTCRVFGSADIEGREDSDEARQRSYAGHVRFTDMIAVKRKPDDGPIRQLAPLSVPRPGAGQFYLDNRGADLPPPNQPQEILRQWGGSADKQGRRQLRGRKYYWSTKPSSEKPRRADRRAHQSDESTTKARAFPVGQRFDTVVVFDGLTEVELGGLLAALQPSLILTAATSHVENVEVCLPLGGGKPFGFGALTTTLRFERVESAQSRYDDGEAPMITIESAIEKFRASVPEGVQTVWPALSAVLTFDHVNRDRVWYPPGAYWSERQRDGEIFDKGFEFWKTTQGQRLKKEPDRPLLPLPDPAQGAEQQYLPIRRAPR